MSRWLILCAICSWAAISFAGPQKVAARMRHVLLHMGYGVALGVDDLRGQLVSLTAGPPTFDDINSYQVNIDFAHVAMTADSLANLMNLYVFPRAQAPLKKLTVKIEGDELVQSGTLRRGIDIPFSMRSTVSVTSDGKLRVHPTSLKAAGFVPKRVLDFFHLELERLVKVKRDAGIAVDGDDLLLDPERMLPPPRIHGRVTRAWLENGLMFLQFGDAKRPGLNPPLASALNYMYYRGGRLRFGKLTMDDADLLLVDADQRDPFDFSPEKYETQLIAGYSRNTPAKGLIVYMPDADKLAKAGERTSY